MRKRPKQLTLFVCDLSSFAESIAFVLHALENLQKETRPYTMYWYIQYIKALDYKHKIINTSGNRFISDGTKLYTFAHNISVMGISVVGLIYGKFFSTISE